MKRTLLLVVSGLIAAALAISGCGYQNSWLHRGDVQTVYVEMFDSTSFRRGYEYVLTDAVCKRIEAQTPYKIVSDRAAADTVLSGRINIGAAVIAGDRYTGLPLERETLVLVNVTWKDLRTGKVLVSDAEVVESATFSDQLGQTFDYSISLAANKAAVRIVELMEIPW